MQGKIGTLFVLVLKTSVNAGKQDSRKDKAQLCNDSQLSRPVDVCFSF